MSGVTEQDISEFEEAFYLEQGKRGDDEGILTVERLQKWCSIIGIPADDKKLQVSLPNY